MHIQKMEHSPSEAYLTDANEERWHHAIRLERLWHILSNLRRQRSHRTVVRWGTVRWYDVRKPYVGDLSLVRTVSVGGEVLGAVVRRTARSYRILAEDRREAEKTA